MFTTPELQALCKMLINTSLPNDDYPHVRSAIRKMEEELTRRENASKIDAHVTRRQKRERRNV